MISFLPSFLSRGKIIGFLVILVPFRTGSFLPRTFQNKLVQTCDSLPFYRFIPFFPFYLRFLSAFGNLFLCFIHYVCVRTSDPFQSVLWWLGHLLFRHWDISTLTIRHCNNSTQERFHFVTIRPQGVGVLGHPQTTQFDPSKVGGKVGRDIPTHELPRQKTYLYSAPPWGQRDISEHCAQMALIKNGTVPPDMPPMVARWQGSNCYNVWTCGSVCRNV
jgi:hypothetical protein